MGMPAVSVWATGHTDALVNGLAHFSLNRVLDALVENLQKLVVQPLVLALCGWRAAVIMRWWAVTNDERFEAVQHVTAGKLRWLARAGS